MRRFSPFQVIVTLSSLEPSFQNTANILCEQGVLSEKQKMCVSNAFFQVGVESGSLLAASEITLNVYDINGEIYDNYTLQVLYNDTETSYEGTNVNSDGISFPRIRKLSIANH